MKLHKTLLTSIFALMATGSMHAASVIFSETFGTATSTTSFAGHTTANGFDNNSLSFSGTGDLRSSTASTTYSGASGLANVFLTNNGTATLMISGISTMGFEPGSVSISFGAHKNLNASDMTTLLFEYSSNGTDWTPIGIPAQPTGSGTSNWRLLEFANTAMPITETLSLRWSNEGVGTGFTQYRIDDVTLTAIPEPTTVLLGGLGMLALLRRRR